VQEWRLESKSKHRYQEESDASFVVAIVLHLEILCQSDFKRILYYRTMIHGWSVPKHAFFAADLQEGKAEENYQST
jgi:hypothetical protein